MTDAIIWVFIIGGIALIATAIYDLCFRCKHEWEQKTYSAIDYASLNKVNIVCLICKKCGKVKYLK